MSRKKAVPSHLVQFSPVFLYVDIADAGFQGFVAEFLGIIQPLGERVLRHGALDSSGVKSLVGAVIEHPYRIVFQLGFESFFCAYLATGFHCLARRDVAAILISRPHFFPEDAMAQLAGLGKGFPYNGFIEIDIEKIQQRTKFHPPAMPECPVVTLSDPIFCFG